MKKIFVDASGVVAILNTRDINHSKAKDILRYLTRTNAVHLFSTDYVLTEVANACSKIGWREKAVEFIESFLSKKECSMIKIDQFIFKEAFLYYAVHTDKEWGLTDCTSFIIMQNLEIQEAFTHDKHFEQAGFIRLIT